MLRWMVLYLGDEPLNDGVNSSKVTSLDLVGLQGVRATHFSQHLDDVFGKLAAV